MMQHPKTAVVSGAAGGLGRELLLKLSLAGYVVIGLDRERPDVASSEATVLRVDLDDASSVAQAVAAIQRMAGAVDVLVNCAGSFAPDPGPGSIASVANAMWKDNCLSAVLLTEHLRDLLTASRSAIVINIGSTDGIVASCGQESEIGVRHATLYAATKGALVAYTRALAMKWAPLGIRVNAVCPTIFDSPMTRGLLDKPEKERQLASHIPLGRLATTADIATSVIALINLHMTTGHVIPVDGGYLCQ